MKSPTAPTSHLPGGPSDNSTTLHLARYQAPHLPALPIDRCSLHDGSMNAYRDYAGEPPTFRGESEIGSRAEAQDTFLVRPTANA
jgi:hypothetical protein